MTLGANSYGAKLAWEGVLDEIEDYLEQRQDITDNADGTQRANEAMSLLSDLRWWRQKPAPSGPDGDSPPIHLIRDEALETGFWHGVHVAQRIARESSKEAYDNIESHLYGPDIEALKRSVCDATGGEGS